MGDSIVRKTYSRLSKGEDVVVFLPGARIEHVTERVAQIIRRGNGGSIRVHVQTNNADKAGTTAIVEKYRNLLKKWPRYWPIRPSNRNRNEHVISVSRDPAGQSEAFVPQPPSSNINICFATHTIRMTKTN